MRDDPAWSIAKLALAGRRHSDPQVRKVAAAIEDWWMRGATDRLDAALGLQPSAGQRSRQTQAQLSRRDDLVRKAAARFPDMKRAGAAEALHKAWFRYASSSWPRERVFDDVPSHRSGKPEALFWQIMRIEDRVLSERTIRRILATS